MSATIHTVSATEFRTAMTAEQRLAFLAEVGSEFLTKEGRGRNIKTTFGAMPESYSKLFARRVRQAAAADAAVKPSKATAEQVDAKHAEVLAKAIEAAS